jgi:muconolactone delta-isomerase
MLYMFRASLKKPADWDNQAFYGLWKKEAEAAVSLMQAGVIRHAFKVAGSPEVIGIVEVQSLDELDQIMAQLPIFQSGNGHLVDNLQWTPLREYEAWYENVSDLAVPS